MVGCEGKLDRRLLLFRDTIFSFQASFVPVLIMTDGGPGYATTYLPLFIYTNAFEYLRYGYAAGGNAGDIRSGRGSAYAHCRHWTAPTTRYSSPAPSPPPHR